MKPFPAHGLGDGLFAGRLWDGGGERGTEGELAWKRSINCDGSSSVHVSINL